jgi:hypothetical protein
MKGYLQPGERVIETVNARVDVRAYATNAEAPVPWANLARPAHEGSVTLTEDRLLVVFNPGNERAVSVPGANVLLAWERAPKGRKELPAQFVFLLPAGLHAVCELEAADLAAVARLRRIVHSLARAGAAARLDASSASSAPAADGGEITAIMAAVM